MNRLRYKAFDKRTNKIIDVGILNIQQEQIFIAWIDENGIQHNRKIEDVSIIQCTAVKDKNGKLIYEGDIVKIRDYNPLGWMRERIGIVKYLYGTHYPAFYIVTTYGDAKDFNNDMEVIGNKYQHPELLEVNNEDA